LLPEVLPPACPQPASVRARRDAGDAGPEPGRSDGRRHHRELLAARGRLSGSAAHRVTVPAWWFDWLPQHGLADTQRTDRYRATRNRVGAEWLFTPVLLSQNYHLVHHLHPSVPFHRYLRTWKRNE
jgi:hypothetical protein